MRVVPRGVLVAAMAWGILAATGVQAQSQTPPVDPNALLKPLTDMGKPLFRDNCSDCHGTNGEGIIGPKLDGNSFLTERSSVITQILFGDLAHGMPGFANELTDAQIAAIATYVRNAWSNHYGVVLPQSVAMRRPTDASEATPAADAAK